jgi:hypothetical protein
MEFVANAGAGCTRRTYYPAPAATAGQNGEDGDELPPIDTSRR